MTDWGVPWKAGLLGGHGCYMHEPIADVITFTRHTQYQESKIADAGCVKGEMGKTGEF